MVTSNTQVVGVAPDMSLDEFAKVLIEGSALSADDINQSYQAVIKWKVSPAFALSIFRKESKFGLDPTSIVFKFKTNNPGNCRSSTVGSLPLISTDKGVFVKYPDWATGFGDLAHRLVAPDYVYNQEKLVTIEQIINRWAPPSENNTELYIANVITFMNQWIGGESMADLFPTAADLGLPANMVRIHKAADIGPWRDLSQVKWDIAHDTQGGFIGSESTLTADDNNVASCHALINTDGYTVLCVPLDYTAWTPGNDYYAERSINIELVGWQTGPYTEAQYRSYAAYYRWATAQGCPIANAYIGKKGLASGHLGHEDVPNPFGPGFGGRSGHTDPGAYFLWDKFIQYCGGDVAVFNSNPRSLNVGPGMLDYAKLHQLKLITNEQFFLPDNNQPGLGKMSRAWVQDQKGVTYILMASELVELAKPGETTPWKVECYELI